MADWQKGDLALCVARDPQADCAGSYWTPPIGSISTVIHVRIGLDHANQEFVALWFKEDATPTPFGAFDAACFRKITPGSKIEGIEEPRRVPVREDA